MSRRKRNTARGKSGDRIERSFLRVMPELPALLQTLKVQTENFDGSEPRTFRVTIQKECNRFVERLRGRERRLNRLFIFLLTRFAAKVWSKKLSLEIIALTKTSASTDSRYSLLLKLMHEVDTKIPFASIVVSYCYADPLQFFDSRSLALHALKRAKEASGESRAYQALDAFVKTVELVYKPYLNILWLLSYYKLGKRPPSEPPALGEMLRVASDRLQDYPGLLDVDAVWIRNSAVHDPPNPNLQEGSLRLTDQKGSHRSFAVDDLISRAESLYLLAAQTMQYVAMLYFYREFILRTGLNDMIAECIALELAGDKNKLAEAEQRAQAHADSLLDPLLRLLKQK